jgi:hypothetical protein
MILLPRSSNSESKITAQLAEQLIVHFFLAVFLFFLPYLPHKIIKLFGKSRLSLQGKGDLQELPGNKTVQCPDIPLHEKVLIGLC